MSSDIFVEPQESRGSIDRWDGVEVTKEQVTVVIPVLNEEKAIGLVLDEVKAEGYDNILVVDGYSSDNSVNVAQDRNVMVIFQHGSGKTSAIKTAIENVSTPYLLIMDGDHTYSGKDIEKFLNHACRYAHIIGVRKNENIGFLHTFGNKLITRTFNILFGIGLSDICSGMYMLKTEVAKRLVLDSKRFCVEVEITAQTVIEHDVTEVPIYYKSRIGERKLSTFKDGFQILSTLIDLARRYNPVFFFSTISALSILPAFAIFAMVFYRYLIMGIFHSGWALFGVMLLLLASQGFTVATIALLMKRMEFRLMRKGN